MTKSEIEEAVATAVKQAFRESDLHAAIEQAVADAIQERLTPHGKKLYEQGRRSLAGDGDAKKIARLHGPGNGRVQPRHVKYVDALRVLGSGD